MVVVLTPPLKRWANNHCAYGAGQLAALAWREGNQHCGYGAGLINNTPAGRG
jgi:hypothetical protein